MGDGRTALAERLASGHYGDAFNYLIREDVVDAVWSDAGADGLEAVVADASAPMRARFLAAEVLFERDFTFAARVGEERVAAIYAHALTHDFTGRANSWGLLYEHRDEGPVGIRFAMLGEGAIPALRALLDDDRTTLVYDGSEAATVGNAYGYRIRDYAAFYLSSITGLPVRWHAAEADRDAEIARLQEQLDARS